MKTTKSVLFAAAALACAACSTEHETAAADNSPVAAQVAAGIDGVLSRASETKWDANDQIGISCTSIRTNYTNMQYETTGDGKFEHVGGAATGIFFQDKEEVTFSAYYPFSGAEGILPDPHVSTAQQTAQKTFDFLYATGATASRESSTVYFTFQHRMTRLILNIGTDANSGFSADEVFGGTYSLKGLSLTGSFDPETGIAAASDDVEETFWEITAEASDDEQACIRTYSMIFYPQAGRTLTFQAVIDGEIYTCEIDPELAAATSYTFGITAKKEGLSVGTCEITDWTTGVGGAVDATM